MRVWEFEDKKEAPSNLVREQDFILRVRRMQRTGIPCLVLNFMLNAIEPLKKDEKLMVLAQKKLKAYASLTNGAYFEMSNGDVFLVWENPGESRLMASRAVEAALPEYENNTSIFLLTYRMPDNYALLRESTNAYVDDVRAKIAVREEEESIDESTGRLTAKNVDQIERLLGDTDVTRYGRMQVIYRHDHGAWTPLAEEYFISIEELRREYFPKLDIAGSEHFFFSVCSVLDRKLLTAMTDAYDTVAGKTVNLNLSISSIMGTIFAQFVRRVPQDQRRLIGFELHCGDLLQNFALTLDAITSLRREGFRIIIDSLTPSMALYLNLDKFPVDRIKINVTKELVAQLDDSDVQKALGKVPTEKIIFFHCDNERALKLGIEMGVSTYQGWLIDELSTKGK